MKSSFENSRAASETSHPYLATAFLLPLRPSVRAPLPFPLCPSVSHPEPHPIRDPGAWISIIIGHHKSSQNSTDHRRRRAYDSHAGGRLTAMLSNPHPPRGLDPRWPKASLTPFLTPQQPQRGTPKFRLTVRGKAQGEGTSAPPTAWGSFAILLSHLASSLGFSSLSAPGRATLFPFASTTHPGRQPFHPQPR